MFSSAFLAMTPGELAKYTPPKAAYMACHFSPYAKGLSNTPAKLPENSLLLLDDSLPPSEHDPQWIVSQLQKLVDTFHIKAVLLDFQREKTHAAACIAKAVTEGLSCPVAVTEAYARSLNCSVLLSPPPVNQPLEQYLSPWLKQGVYLEIAPETRKIVVTEKDSTTTSLSSAPILPFLDRRLHCHYCVEVSDKKAIFTLSRTKEDLLSLTEKALELGALGVLGLYQELGKE